MSERPFFSIIIPVYNASAYLRKCLQCIVDQDFQNWETILVDDGSTDNSVDVAEEFIKSNSKFKLFKSSKNSGGAYVPRLRAATLASGKYLVCIDADDKVSSDFLKIQYKSITSLNADLVLTELWRLQGSVCYKILPLESIDISKVWEGKDLVEHTLCYWKISMSGFALKRDVFLKADSQLSDKDKKSIFADELLSRWILFLSQNVVINNARYYYRYNEDSVTHTNIPRFIESKLLTCDSLIDMTAKTFGEDTPTHLRALDNKFLSTVDLLRMINNSKLNSKLKTIAINRISAAMKNFNFSKLKGRMSWRYLAVMQLSIPVARIAFKILDPIMGVNRRHA